MTVKRRGLKMPVVKSQGVKAGILAGATYPEQSYKDAKTGKMVPDKRAGKPVAMYAAALNYGTSKLPSRPFMGQTIRQQKKAWSSGLVKLLQDGVPLADALATIGQIMQEDIQDTIQSWPADNSEKWAAHKGFNHGLIYTHVLVRSVKFNVMGA
jgi:hypothetical protein